MPLRTTALAAALFLCLATAAGAATVQVQQIGMTFQPADITIKVGDTVQWVWTSGFHTVTSGTGATDPEVGSLFDLGLTSGSASYTFMAEGDVPYFCRPHEIFDMKGLVHVQSSTGIANEDSSFGRIKALY